MDDDEDEGEDEGDDECEGDDGGKGDDVVENVDRDEENDITMTGIPAMHVHKVCSGRG